MAVYVNKTEFAKNAVIAIFNNVFDAHNHHGWAKFVNYDVLWSPMKMKTIIRVYVDGWGTRGAFGCDLGDYKSHEEISEEIKDLAEHTYAYILLISEEEKTDGRHSGFNY